MFHVPSFAAVCLSMTLAAFPAAAQVSGAAPDPTAAGSAPSPTAASAAPDPVAGRVNAPRGTFQDRAAGCAQSVTARGGKNKAARIGRCSNR